jgi:hypothetical protein
MDPNEIEHRANAAIASWLDLAGRHEHDGRIADAKKAVGAAQKELKLIKSEVIAAEREMRADYTDARNKVAKKGQVIGQFMGSKGRGSLARGRAADRRGLAEHQASDTALFRRVKAALDDAHAQLERMKLDIQRQAASRPAPPPLGGPLVPSSAPPLPPPPRPLSSPPTWAPDPTGRHEARWWDGTTWTPHVSNRGVQNHDPL